MIKKILLRIITILFVTIILSSFGFSFENNIVNVLYTVIGIIFSILVSLTISFNLENITDNRFIKYIRDKIYNLQKIFIAYFLITTIVFAFNGKTFDLSFKIIHFKSDVFYVSIMFFAILFFMTNFLQLQKLKDEILNKTHNITNI